MVKYHGSKSEVQTTSKTGVLKKPDTLVNYPNTRYFGCYKLGFLMWRMNIFSISKLSTVAIA